MVLELNQFLIGQFLRLQHLFMFMLIIMKFYLMNNPGRIYFGHDGGISRSDDNGQSLLQ